MERYYIRMEVVIMSFFDEMKESLVSAGKDVSQKAKEVSGVAKLKLDVKSKEDYVEKQYAELGRTYFDAHRDDEENAENEQFTVIKEALAERKISQSRYNNYGDLKSSGCSRMSKLWSKNATGSIFLQQLWNKNGRAGAFYRRSC